MRVARRYGRAARARPSQRKSALVTLFFLLIIALYFLVLTVDSKVNRVIAEVGASSVQTLVNHAVVLAVEKTFDEAPITYGDLVFLDKDASGALVALTTNVTAVNRLKADITKQVEIALTTDELTVEIPLGNLMNVDIFTGLGPEISFTLIPYSNVNVDIENEFISAGINQTLHRLFLTVHSGISIVLPASTVDTTIVTTVPVAETVIIGEVPDNYTNVTDASEWMQDQIIDFRNE